MTINFPKIPIRDPEDFIRHVRKYHQFGYPDPNIQPNAATRGYHLFQHTNFPFDHAHPDGDLEYGQEIAPVIPLNAPTPDVALPLPGSDGDPSV